MSEPKKEQPVDKDKFIWQEGEIEIVEEGEGEFEEGEEEEQEQE